MEKLTINPKRLDWCLKYYRVGLEELAAKVKISPATLQRAREGKPALSYKQLRRLTERFAVDRLFFIDDEEPNVQQMLTPQFRTVKDSMPPRRSLDMVGLISRVEKHRSGYKGVLEEIELEEDWLNTKPLPSFSDRSAFAANGEKVQQWLGIKGGEGFDELRQLVVDKNIMVFVSLGHRGRWRVPEDESGEQVRGFALDYETLPVIFVTKQQDKKAQAFTLMHELGHLIMHKSSKVDDAKSMSFFPAARKTEEWEANMLASHILLPERTLQNIDAAPFASLGFDQIKRRLSRVCEERCISAAAVLARLCMAGKIPRRVYEEYVKWSQSLPRPAGGGGGRQPHKERIHIFGRNYILAMLEAVARKELTKSKALVYLDTNLSGYAELKKHKW